MNPEKIYLGNTNLMYAFSSRLNIGTMRETFFINQLSAAVSEAEAEGEGEGAVEGVIGGEVGEVKT